MILGYYARLACLCLAAFFAAHLLLGGALSLLARRAAARALALPPRRGARFLFALRILPPVLAAFLVFGLCLPGYLLFEPRHAVERVGLACLAAAALGALVLLTGSARGVAALVRTALFLRRAPSAGRPVMLIAGLLRPRLILPPELAARLSAEELDAALRHERAHGRARDNMKRLLLALTPDLLPLLPAARALDRAWRRLTEWAADDEAVGGDPARALALASALVRVGRMGACSALPPLARGLLDDSNDLRARVHRLLSLPHYAEAPRRRWLLLAVPSLPCAVYAFEPTMQSTWRLWEALLR